MKKLLIILFLFNSHFCFTQSKSVNYEKAANEKFNKRDFKGAIIEYTKAIELEPRNNYFYDNRGQAKLNIGDKIGAIDDFTKAISLDNNDDFAYYKRAIAKYRLNDFNGSIIDSQNALKFENDYKMGLYYYLGECNYQIRNYDTAIYYFSNLIDLNPTNGFAYIRRGEIQLYHQSKFNEAISDYSKAIYLDSDYKDSIVICGDVNFKLGKYAESLSNYYSIIKSINLNDKNKASFDYLEIIYLKTGLCFENLGNYKRASRFYEEGVKLQYSVPRFWHNFNSLPYNDSIFNLSYGEYDNVVRRLRKLNFNKYLKYVSKDFFNDPEGTANDFDFETLFWFVVNMIWIVPLFLMYIYIRKRFIWLKWTRFIFNLPNNIKEFISQFISFLKLKFSEIRLLRLIHKSKVIFIAIISFSLLYLLQHSKFTKNVTSVQIPEKADKGVPLIYYKDSIDVVYCFRFTSLLNNEIKVLKEINNNEYEFKNDGINGVKLVPDFIDKEQVYFSAAWKDFRTIFLFGWLFEYDKIT